MSEREKRNRKEEMEPPFLSKLEIRMFKIIGRSLRYNHPNSDSGNFIWIYDGLFIIRNFLKLAMNISGNFVKWNKPDPYKKY